MFRKLGRRIRRFAGARAAAAGRFIMRSRPVRWLAGQHAVRVAIRILVLLWNLLARYLWWPVKRLVRRVRKFMGRHEVWYWVAAWAGCAVLAWGILQASPQQVVAPVLGLFVLAVIARRLELGIVALMITTASFINPSAIPRPITAGGMGPNVAELLIVFMLIAVFLQFSTRRKFELFKSPLTLPLLLLCAAVLISMLVSYVNYLGDPRGIWPFERVYNSVRQMFLYLLFFPIAFGIRTERQLNLTLRLLIWVAAMVAIMMVIQYFLGTDKSLFIGTRFTPGYTTALSPEEEKVARSLPPGIALMLAFFLVPLAQAAYRGLRAGIVPATAASVVGAGLIFTFARNYWISMFVGVFVIWLLANRTVKSRLAMVAVVVAVFSVVGSLSLAKLAPGTAGERFSRALSERFVSLIHRPTYTVGESFQSRLRENRSAIQQIKRSPVFGIGADAPRQYGEWTRPGLWTKVIYPVYFIHNSYLELWMVYGLLGILSFIWMSIAFLLRAFVLSRRARDPTWRILAISFFAGYVAFLIRAAVTMNATHEMHNIAVAALMWGIVEAIWRLNEQAQADAKAASVPVQAEPAVVRV